MGVLSDLKMYGRFAWGLRGFLRHPITLGEAKAIVQRRMAEREENFLLLVRKGIFGYPKSPYLPLLKLAQSEMGDIEQMVKSKGLEGTLRALRDAGVYVTFEEFKGREPIVRRNQVLPVNPHDFDNPYLDKFYYAETGGTTGAGTRVPTDLDHLAAQAPNIMLACEAHGVLNVPTAIWYGILPDGTGFNNLLRQARFGQLPERWFSPLAGEALKPSIKNRFATLYLVGMGRLFGVPIPAPEPILLNQAGLVACWASEALKRQGACLIRTHVSMALRVCIAAKEKGIDLTGATFICSGEPPTPAKVKGIRQSGARYISLYVFTEAGHLGMGCLWPKDENDNHFFKDLFSLIQHPRKLESFSLTVNAFYFTSLVPTAPKLMLNVESDDYGLIETRSCGCPLEGYGFTEHLRHIRSFRKLTGEGVTLVGSEMVQILEEELPARFGGGPLDYQLLEEEDEQGFTRLSLLISPKIEIIDERRVIEFVLGALGRSSVAANLARVIWDQASTLQVKRREPIWTARGKLMPLHLVRRSEALGEDKLTPTNDG